jgi:hypothetical protein
MHMLEKRLIEEFAPKRNPEEWTIIDGGIRKGEFIELHRTVGVAKSFDRTPTFTLRKGNKGTMRKDISALLAGLKYAHRTVAFFAHGGKVAFWYVRLREQGEVDYPLMGVVKVEVRTPDRIHPLAEAPVSRESTMKQSANGERPLVIGKTSATERDANSSDRFNFWLAPDQIVNPFDIVEVEHLGEARDNSGKPSGKPSCSYGLVTTIEHKTDSPNHLANFVSSNFGDVNELDINTPRVGTNVAKVNILANNGEIYIIPASAASPPKHPLRCSCFNPCCKRRGRPKMKTVRRFPSESRSSS